MTLVHSEADGLSVPAEQTERPYAQWTLKGDHDHADVSVDFGHGGYYYTIYEPGRARPVAFVIGKGSGYESDAEDSRNEALAMAAARELLEAAKLAEDIIGDFVAGSPEDLKAADALRSLQEAIAKALGTEA